MKPLAFFAAEIHPTTPGGCGVFLRYAAESLARRGTPVILALDLPQPLFDSFLSRELAPLALASLSAVRIADLAPPPPDSIPQPLHAALHWLHALRALHARHPLAAAEFHDFWGSGALACAAKRFADPDALPPLFVRLHGTLELLDVVGHGTPPDAARLLSYGMERASLRLAETILSPSRAYLHHHAHSLYHLSPDHVAVSPPPKRPLPPPPPSDAPASARAPFRVVFVGRLFHLKGVDQLIHACVLLLADRPDIDLAVELLGYDSTEGPGGSSYAAFLLSQIPARHRHRFTFAGHRSHEDVAAALARASAAVFPSKIESFCYALHEAYDAGACVVIRDLPAFADFFRHDHNALIYDGTAPDLARALARLHDDPALRSRLRKPYPVDESPLGDIYAHPHATRPLAPAQSPHTMQSGTPSLSTLILILATTPPAPASLAHLRARCAATPQTRALLLHPARAGQDECLYLLDRFWHITDLDGTPLAPGSLLTSDTLLVLHHDDDLDESFLPLCRRALLRGATSGVAPAFAGSWWLQDTDLRPVLLDLTPERAALDLWGQLPRALLATTPGLPLSELLDETLGVMGLTDLFWSTLEARGSGVITPDPLIRVFTPQPLGTPSPRAIHALLARAADRTGPLAQALLRLLASSSPDAPLRTHDKIRIADELGGRTLARLAFAKLARRVREPEP